MLNEVRDGTTEEGHRVSEEDQSKRNEVAKDVKDHSGRGDVPLLNGCPTEKVQQPPLLPPGPNIRWERFLPVRSLKVLLVEYDDSTRQVVTALLRNCSYEVIAASNGLQAWNILEDLTNHVDLVLTEVVMPGLSGVGLLSKIMCHKTCKNIPVIMMSSHDSMGIVFKCLSKGSVDFLVKPIRKNELKNLWQHVWRRCHSSSGSGSESAVQNQKSSKPKTADDSDNDTASTDEDDNGSIGLNAGDGSDNGSGTQSSWTKRAAELESPRPVSPLDQLVDIHDSTGARVIHPKSENFCSRLVQMNAKKDTQEANKPDEGHIMGKNLEIGMPSGDSLNIPYPTKWLSANPTCSISDESLQKEENKNGKETGLECGSSEAPCETNKLAADLLGGINNASSVDMTGRIADASNDLCKTKESDEKSNRDSVNRPSLELSLKRPQPYRAINEDCTVLRHSDHSAFTRYNSSTASNQAPAEYGGTSPVPADNYYGAMKTESTYKMISDSNASPLKQGSNGSSNNNDVGSTAKNNFTKTATFKDKTTIISNVNFSEPPCSFHPVQQRDSGSQQVTQERKDGVETTASVGQQIQVQHHHHHYHHHHHHLHNIKQQQEQDHCDLSHQHNKVTAAQCGSSNVIEGPSEGIAANFSVNGSGSGSNHGSNGQNGNIAAFNTAMNVDSDNNRIGERSAGGGSKSGSGSRSGSGSGSGSGLASTRFTKREAALTKFRQKRKERNFEKKVRYQSRKKLAEQRPRIRGQFVKQVAQENTTHEEHI